MDKKHFYFKGCVMLFNNIIDFNYEAETYATTKKKALNNLIYRAKEKLGLLPNSKIILDGELTEN